MGGFSRRAWLALGSMAFWSVAGCDSPTGPRVATGTFVAQVTGAQEVLVIEVAEDDGDGQTVKAYLCDGEPGGDVEWYGGVIAASEIVLSSRNNPHSTLTLRFAGGEVSGTVKLAAGAEVAFAASPAAPGEGIYLITVNASGLHQGISLAGDSLTANTVVGGAVDCDHNTLRGTVRTAAGQVVKFGAHNMTTCSAAELTGRGHTPIFATSGLTGSVPDSYAAVVQRRGVDWVVYGRATTFPIRLVKIPSPLAFVPGSNFIGLNMDDCCP